MGRCLTILAMLIIAWFAWGVSGAQAVGPLSLKLRLTSGGSMCTAGAMTQVSWEITGGEAPYRLWIAGEPVEAEAEADSVQIVCASALGNAPGWLHDIVRRYEIGAFVKDAEGAGAAAVLHVQPLPALMLRSTISARSGFGFDGTSDWPVQALTVSFGSLMPNSQSRSTGDFLVRWREVGAESWLYETHSVSPGQNSYRNDWSAIHVRAGVRYEVEVARLRSLLEAKSPEALHWSRRHLATISTRARDIAAYVTSEAIHLNWKPELEGIHWHVRICPQPLHPHFCAERFRPMSVGPDSPYEVRLDNLRPDTLYHIDIREPRVSWRLPETISVRTEPSPEGNATAAQYFERVDTQFNDGRIVVRWESREGEAESVVQVKVGELGAPNQLRREVEVAAGIRKVEFDRIVSGTAYQIVVRPRDEDSAPVERVLQIPPDGHRERGFGIRVPAWRVEVKQLKSGSYVFTMTHDGDLSIKAAEFEWIRDGYTMRRTGGNARLYFHSDSAGPFPFRMRVRGSDGTWSRWTQSRLVGLLPSPPFNVQYQARDAALYVRWESPVDNVEIDGYRAFLMSIGEPVQTLDLESSTHAVFALHDKHDEYSLHVGALSGELGLGSLRRVDVDLSREPELRLHLFDHQPTCDPEEGLAVEGHWQVIRGVAPFRVTVGDVSTFESISPIGKLELGCAFGQDGTPAQGGEVRLLDIQVVDARGRQMIETFRYLVSQPEQAARSEHRVETRAVPLSVVSKSRIVGRSRIEIPIGTHLRFLSIRDIWLRWRLDGQVGWNYERMPIVEQPGDWTAIVHWQDLQSGTRYEYQVAPDVLGVELPELDADSWTEVQEVVTLPVEVAAVARRNGSTVAVSWESLPDADFYTVVLRGAGESWWMPYTSNGTGWETALFENIPPGIPLQPEVITPRVESPYSEW